MEDPIFVDKILQDLNKKYLFSKELKLSVVVISSKIDKSIDLSKINCDQETDKKFHNSKTINLVHNESDKISCKFFSNGSMQITGCKTYKTASEITDVIINKYLTNNNKIYESVSTLKFYMKLDTNINRETIRNKINFLIKNEPGNWLFIVPSNDKYHAVIAKYSPLKNPKETVSVMFFSTGTVSINCKFIGDLVEVIDKIHELLTS